MHLPRTIAALLAVSALLYAGWTRTTHWHSHAEWHSQAEWHSHAEWHSNVHGDSHEHGDFGEHEHPHAEAFDSASCQAELDCRGVVGQAVADFQADVSATFNAGKPAHTGGHCSICDFLASHVFGLAKVYEFAGMLTECQRMPELLFDTPGTQLRRVTCRGPPMVV